MRKLAHHLLVFGAFRLGTLFAGGCGEDSEQPYAGLDVASATAADGIGYRVRYLSPPWDKSKIDPLVLGTDKGVELAGETNAAFLPDTATVLEIDRESIIMDSGLTLAKYRFEATLHDCDLPLAAGETCAQRIAIADEEVRGDKGEPSFYADGVKTQQNDFDQTFYEIITRSKDNLRYKRVAYYETAIPDRFLRVYIEANPRLDEAEVTRMLKAVETFQRVGFVAAEDAGTAP